MGNRRGQLDEVSKTIVACLQRDGRTPYSEIARQVGLSEAAIRQRVQRLVDRGVMQIVAVTDPLQVGFAMEAMVAVRTRGNPEAVAEALEAIEEVDYLALTAGRFDIILEVVAESEDHLLDLVGRIRDVPGVEATEVFVYLKTRKQDYAWGVR